MLLSLGLCRQPLFHPLKYDCAFLGLCCACFVRVLPCFSVVYLLGHTVYTAPFQQLHVRKHMLAASVMTTDRKQHKTCKIHAQNMQTLLDY